MSEEIEEVKVRAGSSIFVIFDRCLNCENYKENCDGLGAPARSTLISCGFGKRYKKKKSK